MSVRYYTHEARIALRQTDPSLIGQFGVAFDPAAGEATPHEPETYSTYNTPEEALLQAAHDMLTGSATPRRITDEDGQTIHTEAQIRAASKRLAKHRRAENLRRDANHPTPDLPPVASGEIEAVAGGEQEAVR